MIHADDMPKSGRYPSGRLLFIINPVSGNIAKSDLRRKIIREVEGKVEPPLFFETTGEDDLEKLMQVVNETRPERLIAAGGDGTANLAARAALRSHNISVGFLPLGTANGIATELGIPDDLPGALEVAVGGKEIAMDMLRINGKYYSIHLSDLGFNAHVIRRFDQEGRRGLVNYARMFITELFRMESHNYVIHTREGKTNVRAVMIVFANAGHYGTGAVINPKGRVNDGRFELIILKPYRIWHVLRMVVPFFTGNIDRLHYIDFYTGKSFIVENPDMQDLHIDGEIVPPEEKIRVQILEQALRVLVPSVNYPEE